MSNYFDNQTNWSWNVTDGKATVVTLHTYPKPHSHTLDVTNASIGEMAANPGKILGEAHRAASHDYEPAKPGGRESTVKSDFLKSLRADQAAIARTNKAGRFFSQKESATKARPDNGGRRDDGPGKLSRASGNKTGSAQVAAIRANMMSTGKTASSVQVKSGQVAGKYTAPAAHSAPAKGGATGGKTGAGSTGVSPGGKGGHNGGHGGGHSGH